MAHPPSGYISLTNFEKYQQYRDGRPLHWIKLYLSLLDDYTFCALPDAVKWQFIGLMLLAGKYDNKIPADKGFLATKLSCKSVDLDLLLDRGFIAYETVRNRTELSDDPLLRVEKSRVEESREEKTASADEFERFWDAYPKKKGKGDALAMWKKNGHPPISEIVTVLARAVRTTDWMKDSGQFIPYPATWLHKKMWDDEYVTVEEQQAAAEKHVRETYGDKLR